VTGNVACSSRPSDAWNSRWPTLPGKTRSSRLFISLFHVFGDEATSLVVGSRPYYVGLSHVGNCKEIDNSQECEGAPTADSPPGQAPLRITQEKNK
jgi:hypothetical protein